jgi:hypothetical protein
MSSFVLDKEAELVAECFSAHYTNIFLVYLYNEARKFVEKEANIPSLTEGYKTAIAVYNNAISRNDFVKQTIHGIYNQYLKVNNTLRMRECIFKILKAFFPDDGYKVIILQESLIDKAINKIIVDVTKQIIMSVPVNHAQNVIDRNADIKTVDNMQDDFKNIVLELMEMNNIEYMTKKKAQYHSPGTDHAMFEKVKAELIKMNNEKTELENKYKNLLKQLNDLQATNNDLREKVGNQNTRIKELESRVQHVPQHIPQYTTPQNPIAEIPPSPPPTRRKGDYSHLLHQSDDEDDHINGGKPDDDEISLDMYK